METKTNIQTPIPLPIYITRDGRCDYLANAKARLMYMFLVFSAWFERKSRL